MLKIIKLKVEDSPYKKRGFFYVVADKDGYMASKLYNTKKAAQKFLDSVQQDIDLGLINSIGEY